MTGGRESRMRYPFFIVTLLGILTSQHGLRSGTTGYPSALPASAPIDPCADPSPPKSAASSARRRPILSRHDLRVHVHRHRGGAVADHLTDHVDGHARLDSERDGGMPQVMPAQTRQP
jgi:hypothetical protein